jgi:GT2 family glycosyltransferase
MSDRMGPSCVLSVIIVSYNTRRDLDRCLASLHDRAPAAAHEIIVVDNASSDGSAEAARRWPDVLVIESGANRGFAAGTNIGIRASRGENLLLLNSDTRVPEGAIDQLLETLRARPEVAVIGPRLADEHGRVELSFGSMISPLAELRRQRLLRGQTMGRRWAAKRVAALAATECSPDWVSGACLLVRRDDAEAVGMLDERYFMYTEDVDFCAAIRARGRRVLFTPTVEIIHARGRSAATAPLATRAAYRRSHLAFYDKHHPWMAPLLRVYLNVRGDAPPD